jgi:arabinofuranosyltransferase
MQAWLAFPVLLGPYLWLVDRYWFVCDDAWITFRFSRNLALGNGPRYNLGDHTPVEGYSNFLWMLIAAFFERIGISPGDAMPVLSVGCGVALLASVYAVLLRARVGVPLAWCGTLLLAIFPPFAVWSTSGLATMPQALGMFAAWALLTSADDEPRMWRAAGIAALLLALTRTEGVAWAVVIGVLAAGQRGFEGREIVRPLRDYAAILGVGYGAYFGWRFSYYDSLVANTASAKVHMQASTLVRGFEYLMSYLTTVLSPLALTLAIPLSLQGRNKGIAATAGLLAIGVPAYGVVVSGDYMTWFRILMPGAAFMAVSVTLGMAALVERKQSLQPLAVVVVLGVGVLGFLPSQDVHVVSAKVRKAYNVRDKLGYFRSENQQWEAMVEHVRSWTQKGLALGAYAQPGDTYVAAAIGALGYNSDVFIYDRNGLVNREVAAQPWSGELRSPGHDKVVDRSFFYDDKPDILDSKLVTGPGVRTRVKYALKEMEVREVRTEYYPELIELDRLGNRKARRFFVPLRRGDDPKDVVAGWERFDAALAGIAKDPEDEEGLDDLLPEDEG